MEKINFIESVAERDIDLILLEELTVSLSFRELFIKTVCKEKIKGLIGVWHSLTEGSFGESDLILLFSTNSTQKYAILIENKINAIEQKEQSERYRKRGEIGVIEKKWEKFKTCIIAPQLYLDRKKSNKKYDHCLPYETIADWLRKENNERSTFKADMIKEAIEQNRRGYIITPDEKVTDFWIKYYFFANSNYPELCMEKPGLKPSKSGFIYFRPKVLGKKIDIVHKLRRNAHHTDADLQIHGEGNNLDEISPKISDVLSENLELVKAGKSASLRISTPSLDRFSPFEEQIDNVKIGLDACMKLLKIGICLKEKKIIP